ncbi:MAG: type IV pilin protein, partial [Myxococcota bacterium]
MRTALHHPHAHPVRRDPVAARRTRRNRQGMNLVEIMIVIAIMVALVAIAIPVVGWALQLNHNDSASTLAAAHERLNAAAIIRNLTLRVAHHLEARHYQ